MNEDGTFRDPQNLTFQKRYRHSSVEDEYAKKSARRESELR